jgi:hypothetical protein
VCFFRKISTLKLLFLVLSVSVFFAGNARCLEQSDALILLNESVSFKEIRSELDKSGIKPNIFFSPNSVYVSGSESDILKLKDNPMIKDIFLSSNDVKEGSFTKEAQTAVKFFSYKKSLAKDTAGNLMKSDGLKSNLVQPKDTLRHDKRKKLSYYPSALGAFIPPAIPADFYFTSEYLIGDVAVAIILPESDGTFMSSTEDWVESRMSNVTSEINTALSWWSNLAFNTNLTFYVKTYLRVPTKYEIISLDSGGDTTDEPLWVNDVMANMGYTDAIYPPGDYDYIDKVFAFNNDLRKGVIDSGIETDWAITFFVIDSFNDADGKFTNDSFAYSYLGGPFTVMTYDNDTYNITRMKDVALHELAHQFYALDEYLTAYEPCDVRSGYIAIDNQNSEFGACTSDVGCVMRDLGRVTFPDIYAAGQVCDYSRGHLGWYDDDSNGVFYPVDTLPVVTVDTYEAGASEFSGTAEVVTAPNLNLLSYPNDVEKIDITSNEIIVLQYRLDQEFWVDIVPDDSELGGKSETFSFKPYPPRTGVFTLEIKAINSAGNETRVVVGDDIFLESFADNSHVSLIEGCFVAKASFSSSFYGKEEPDFVLKKFIDVVRMLFN